LKAILWNKFSLKKSALYYNYIFYTYYFLLLRYLQIWHISYESRTKFVLFFFYSIDFSWREYRLLKKYWHCSYFSEDINVYASQPCFRLNPMCLASSSDSIRTDNGKVFERTKDIYARTRPHLNPMKWEKGHHLSDKLGR